MMQITNYPRRQHDRREDAERAIEIFYPAGYLYEVVDVCIVAGRNTYHTFAIRVISGDGRRFLGFAFDPEEGPSDDLT
jgi:hypothetical protein